MVQHAVDCNNWETMIQPVDSLLLNMKSAVVEEKDIKMVRNGQPINLGRQGFGAKYLESYRLYTRNGNFLAVVRFNKARNRWDPYKVFQLDNPSPFAPE
jgi:tRNA U55 pseudouridine synthase TruB